MFIVLDDITYGKFISTGSIILEGIDESMPYVHHHPHLFQSPLSAINFCIVDHALHRISGKPKDHASHILVHLKLEPASLISSNTLMGFSRPSHPDQELENIMKHMPNISQYSRTSYSFQGPPSSFINEVTPSDGFAEYHLLDYSSISGPNFLSIPSAINLLGNIDIAGKAERFIRAFHPAYINLIEGIKRQAQGGGARHQETNSRLGRVIVLHHQWRHRSTKMEASTSMSSMTEHQHQSSGCIWSAWSTASSMAWSSTAAWPSEHHTSVLSSQLWHQTSGLASSSLPTSYGPQDMASSCHHRLGHQLWHHHCHHWLHWPDISEPHHWHQCMTSLQLHQSDRWGWVEWDTSLVRFLACMPS